MLNRNAFDYFDKVCAAVEVILDNVASNFGIVDIEDNLYTDLAARMAKVTGETYEIKTAP